MRLSILILGESGSGKGVLARLVHGWSDRANDPLVVVDCAAIPADLVESELFGPRKGAALGISRSTLHGRMDRFGIPRPARIRRPR